MGSGIYLQRAVKKYGKANFSVKLLQCCDSKEALEKAEIEWINKNDCVNSDQYYNLAPGGQGGVTITPEADIDRYNSWVKRKTHYGHTMTAQGRQSISDSWKHRTVSEETRKKISETHTGLHRTEETKQKIKESRYRYWSQLEEQNGTRATGRKHSEETKQKMSEARKRYWINKKSSTTIESIAREKDSCEEASRVEVK